MAKMIRKIKKINGNIKFSIERKIQILKWLFMCLVKCIKGEMKKCPGLIYNQETKTFLGAKFELKITDGYEGQKIRDEHMIEDSEPFLYRLYLHGFSKILWLKHGSENIFVFIIKFNNFGWGIYTGGAPARKQFYIGLHFIFFHIQIYPYKIREMNYFLGEQIKAFLHTQAV